MNLASTPPSDAERRAPALRPEGLPAGHQVWSQLLFVHWRFPADVVQAQLPAGLTVDTFDGSAWVGLVPFYMSGVRPRWAPAIPGLSSFCETNVRTYVHHQGRNPGVWFFSLEASNPVAVCVARARWKLPYFRAAMSIGRDRMHIRYRSRRLWPGPRGAGCAIEARLSGALARPCCATPGTLEHFLVERYILYARGSAGRLFTGRVHHPPYRVQPVEITRLDDELLPAAGLAPFGPFCHALFCDGVTVEVFPLQFVAG